MSMKENVIITPESHEAFERSLELLSHSLREIRQVALQMIPESLMFNGLDATLKTYCAEVPKPEGLQVIYESFGLEVDNIEPVRAASIYHIIRELVENAIKHAHAHKLMILVTNRNGKVSIAVEDDGNGFDTAILEGVRGKGWSMILNRTEEIHGKVETQSAPGRGTAVRLTVSSQ